MNVLPKKLTAIASTLLLGAALTGVSTLSHAQTTNPTEPVSMVTQWDKTFTQSDKVDHRKVTFKNRYGITLVADLYLPKNRGKRQAGGHCSERPIWCRKRAVERPLCPDPG
ncbi:hypothetical protein [Aeromonas veronii]|uniref:hypothetical protein n=1 Tax=Aeromonas TaxID=642 RepID=UPI0021E9967F|nr:hypothetical protein [Aeromonas veronii]MCV3284454.1 hypothetical protein [Aeromonas veronii]